MIYICQHLTYNKLVAHINYYKQIEFVIIIYTFRGGCGADYSTFQNILTITYFPLRFSVIYNATNFREAAMKNLSLLFFTFLLLQFSTIADRKGEQYD